MDYQVTPSDSESYVRIRVSGTITADVEKVFTEKAIKEANARNIARFLVDVREAVNIASPADNYYFANEDVELFELPRNSRIAVLVTPDDRSHHFIELVFKNAGYNCQIYEEERAAVEWLEE